MTATAPQPQVIAPMPASRTAPSAVEPVPGEPPSACQQTAGRQRPGPATADPTADRTGPGAGAAEIRRGIADLTTRLRASGSGRRPLIGLTTTVTTASYGAWTDERVAVLKTGYIDAVVAAGGRPVLLPPADAWTDDELDDLDALVLTGGEDLDPATYGEAAHEATRTPNPLRDAFELAAVRGARRLGLPVLGICRGLQIVNVAAGGTLDQHLPETTPAHPDTATGLTDVDVETAPGSAARGLLGDGAVVACYHHQAVARVGAGLRVTAHHASGVVEALEATDGSPLLAVQWHPELEAGCSPLIRDLVDAARERAADRTVNSPGYLGRPIAEVGRASAADVPRRRGVSVA